MTSLERHRLALRLARVAEAHGATGTSAALSRAFLEVLPSGKEKVVLPARECTLCNGVISFRNRSGVCTQCWIDRPDETATIWERVRELGGNK